MVIDNCFLFVLGQRSFNRDIDTYIVTEVEHHVLSSECAPMAVVFIVGSICPHSHAKPDMMHSE